MRTWPWRPFVSFHLGMALCNFAAPGLPNKPESGQIMGDERPILVLTEPTAATRLGSLGNKWYKEE